MRKLLSLLFLLIPLLLSAAKKPNVIVVLADDIGVGDISYYRSMHSDNIVLETPNIDALAKSGMVFTNAHSPAALCAPSRYGMMTGNSCYRSPFPWGVWGAYEKSPIKDKDLTLGRLMKKAGYHTSFFGKWHLGGDYFLKEDPSKIYRGPRKPREIDMDIRRIVDGANQKGFDYSLTFPAGIQAEPYAVYENGNWLPLSEDSEIEFITNEKMAKLNVKLDKKEGLGDSHWDPHNMGPLLVGKAVDYINRRANMKQPFFMYYCSQAVHLPHTPPRELDGIKIAGSTPSRHMDMIKELDVQMGMLIKTLKQQGVYENTMFIFTSDNGGLDYVRASRAAGHRSSDIYRGQKNSEFEGGQRVPFIVSWPGKIEKGRVTPEPMLGLDVMATLAHMTKQRIGEGQAMDSYNLMPLLLGKKKADSHAFLMLQSGTGKEVILIEDGWKLIMQVDKKDKTGKTRTPEALFNLKDNPTEVESGNLIANPEYKRKIEAMFKKYNQFRESKARTDG